MTDERRPSSPHQDPGENFTEKRREDRFRVPSVYRRSITLRVKSDGDFSTVILGSFSRSGIMFLSTAPFKAGSDAECIISIPGVLSREIAFGITVKHCLQTNGDFLVGAAIDTVADAIWFDIFVEVHDFMKKRRDDVY
jgi:hypothetical protein